MATKELLKTEEITGAKILPFPPVVILTAGFLFIRLVISHSTARGGETTTHWKKKKPESAADKPLIDVAFYVKLYQIIKTSIQIQEYKVIFGSLEKTKGRKEGRDSREWGCGVGRGAKVPLALVISPQRMRLVKALMLPISLPSLQVRLLIY